MDRLPSLFCLLSLVVVLVSLGLQSATHQQEVLTPESKTPLPSTPFPSAFCFPSPHPVNIPAAPKSAAHFAYTTAEEIEYENGTREFRGIVPTPSGERVLVVGRNQREGTLQEYSLYSASRLAVLTSDFHAPTLSAALSQMGLLVTRERFGARTLSVYIPESAEFFTVLTVLEEMTKTIGEVLFLPPRDSHIPRLPAELAFGLLPPS